MSGSSGLPRKLAVPTVWLVIVVVLLVTIEGVSSWALAIRSVAFSEPRYVHTRYDTLLGWSNAPDTVFPDAYGPGISIRINSRGFRGEELDDKVPDGPTRIVCSGDSFTFGQGVRNGQDWCHVLSQLDDDVEVVNMGQRGYGVDQAYLWYVRDGLPLDPDVHLFTFIEDDFNRMMTPVRYGVGKPLLRISDGALEVQNVPVPRIRHDVGRAVQRAQLRFVRLGRGLMSRLAREEAPTASEATIGPLASLLFEELRDINAGRGIRSLWVYLPTEVDIERESPMRGMMRSLANDLDVTYLDLTPELRSLRAQRAASMFLPDGHYSVDGNRWVAEAVMRRLRASGILLERPPAPGTETAGSASRGGR